MTQAVATRDTAHTHMAGGPAAALVATLLYVLALFGHFSSVDAKTYAYVFNIGSGDVSVIDTEAQEVSTRSMWAFGSVGSRAGSSTEPVFGLSMAI